MVARDDVGIGLETTLEIGAHGGCENHEQIVLSSMHTHLSGDAHKQRTQIQRGTALIRRNVVLIQQNHLLHHLNEHICRHLGHLNATRRRLHACSVLFWAEESHVAIGTTVGLQSLKRLLSIVQTGSCHVHFNVLVGANFYFAPFTVVVVTAYVVVGWHISKRQTCPVNVLHHIEIFF